MCISKHWLSHTASTRCLLNCFLSPFISSTICTAVYHINLNNLSPHPSLPPHFLLSHVMFLSPSRSFPLLPSPPLFQIELSTSELKACQEELITREELLSSIYHQVAVQFAELHDTPGRMKEKGVISVSHPYPAKFKVRRGALFRTSWTGRRQGSFSTGV